MWTCVRVKENGCQILRVSEDSVCDGLSSTWFYKPCKVEEASLEELSRLRRLISWPLTHLLKGGFTCIKAPALSSNSVYSSFFALSPSLPHPASPDTEPHEIYTAFKLNVNEGYVSLGLRGMMVEIP